MRSGYDFRRVSQFILCGNSEKTWLEMEPKIKRTIDTMIAEKIAEATRDQPNDDNNDNDNVVDSVDNDGNDGSDDDNNNDGNNGETVHFHSELIDRMYASIDIFDGCGRVNISPILDDKLRIGVYSTLYNYQSCHDSQQGVILEHRFAFRRFFTRELTELQNQVDVYDAMPYEWTELTLEL